MVKKKPTAVKKRVVAKTAKAVKRPLVVKKTVKKLTANAAKKPLKAKVVSKNKLTAAQKKVTRPVKKIAVAKKVIKIIAKKKPALKIKVVMKKQPAAKMKVVVKKKLLIKNKSVIKPKPILKAKAVVKKKTVVTSKSVKKKPIAVKLKKAVPKIIAKSSKPIKTAVTKKTKKAVPIKTVTPVAVKKSLPVKKLVIKKKTNLKSEPKVIPKTKNISQEIRSSAVPSVNHDYMTAEHLENFKNLLVEWKNSLMAGVDKTIHHMQDEAANFADPNDRATQEAEFSLELRTRDRERKLMTKIDEAIERIESGDYGFCNECGIEIGLERLNARLTATLCIDCKTLDEIREKQMAN